MACPHQELLLLLWSCCPWLQSAPGLSDLPVAGQPADVVLEGPGVVKARGGSLLPFSPAIPAFRPSSAHLVGKATWEASPFLCSVLAGDCPLMLHPCFPCGHPASSVEAAGGWSWWILSRSGWRAVGECGNWSSQKAIMNHTFGDPCSAVVPFESRLAL